MTRGTVVLMVALLALACADDDGAPKTGSPADAPVVMTTFYPTTYFAERIGGDLVEVRCPCPPDEDAIFWQPPPEVIADYQEADLIVVNGAEFEKWVAKATLPESKLVDTAESFEDEFIHFEQAVTHSHGPAGEHAHEGIDGHTWLDPILAKVQAEEIRDALKRILPDDAAVLDERFAALAADLDGLHERLTELTEAYGGQFLYASHPAFNYVARRYGWRMVNLDLDPEEMPSDEAFAAIAKLLGEKPAKHIFWESAPLPEIAKRFEVELGLESVEFSPCELMAPADLEAGEDYLEVMRANAERIAPALTGSGD